MARQRVHSLKNLKESDSQVAQIFAFVVHLLCLPGMTSTWGDVLAPLWAWFFWMPWAARSVKRK